MLAIWLLPSSWPLSFFFFWTPNHLQRPPAISVYSKHHVRKILSKLNLVTGQVISLRRPSASQRAPETKLGIHVRRSWSAVLRGFQGLWSHGTRGWLRKMRGCWDVVAESMPLVCCVWVATLICLLVFQWFYAKGRSKTRVGTGSTGSPSQSHKGMLSFPTVRLLHGNQHTLTIRYKRTSVWGTISILKIEPQTTSELLKWITPIILLPHSWGQPSKAPVLSPSQCLI